MVEVLDMSIQDAAIELGVAEGTVKSRIHRGREYLRRWLDEYEQEGDI